MKELTTAAQAILSAFAADNYGVWLEGDPARLAAALRELVNQEECYFYSNAHGKEAAVPTPDILRIAAELEQDT